MGEPSNDIGGLVAHKVKVRGSHIRKVGCPKPLIYHLTNPHESLKISWKDSRAFSKECIGLYHKGVSLNEIARIVGRSKSIVRRVLHGKGLLTGVKISEGVYTAWRKSSRTRAQPLFGFTYSMGLLVQEPREYQILMLIKRLAAQGKTPTEITHHLNAKGMKPRSADKWNRNSIQKILDREGSVTKRLSGLITFRPEKAP